jgi:hypothetical protein
MTNDLLDELTTPRVPSRVLFNNLGPSVYRGLSYEECDSLIRFDNISDAIQLHDRWNVPFACYLEWVERQNFACSRRSSNLGLVSVEFSKVRSQEEVVNVMCKYGRVAFTSCLFENIKDGSFKMFIEYEEIDDAALAMALEEEYLVDMLILDSKARSVLFLPTKTDQSKSYDIDIQKVLEGLDQRTTCMIRNIPNKYTQTMLMEWLDGKFAKTYDFLYLRMDFRNHCNVGYAFINFIDYRYF